MMYGKNYESKYDGSLVGAGMNVFAVWDYAIAKCKTGTVEINPKLLAFILGGTVEDVQSALDFLCSPDPNSRSKAEDGRRMVKDGEYQYRLVNWAHYQGLKKADDLKEYNRQMQSEHRERERQKKMARMKGKPLPGEALAIRAEQDGAGVVEQGAIADRVRDEQEVGV